MTMKVQGSNGIEFPDGSVQGSAADAGPAFSVRQTAALGLNNTNQLLSLQTVVYDTTGAWSLLNNRFTPQVAGYYQFNWSVQGDGNAATLYSTIRKNGVDYKNSARPGVSASFQQIVGSALIFMNGSTDYVDITGTANVNTATNSANANTSLEGFLARRAAA